MVIVFDETFEAIEAVCPGIKWSFTVIVKENVIIRIHGACGGMGARIDFDPTLDTEREVYDRLMELAKHITSS